MEGEAATLGDFFVLGVMLGVFFFPAIIAFARNLSNRWSVLIINTFLGWTLLGWVIALAMSASSAKTRKNEKSNTD